jgi:cell division inhibitor SepF
VILNLEGLEYELAQRIIDFSSGSCYALGGNLQWISKYIIIIAPQNINISGDFQNLPSTDDTPVVSPFGRDL